MNRAAAGPAGAREMTRKTTLEEIERVLALAPERKALTAREIAHLLGLSADQRPALRRRLQELVAEGVLVVLRGRRFGSARDLGGVVGRFTRLAAGFGFVVPDDPQQKDIFIPPEGQGNALHGDVVAARVIAVKPDGRRSGRIVGVVERRTDCLVGVFHKTYSGGGLVDPLDSGFGFEVLVPSGKTGGAVTGELVRVELSRFPSEVSSAVGQVVERLGRPEEPGVDVEVLIRKHGLEPEFPEEVEEEVAALPGSPDQWPLAGREDLTGKTFVTIDGEGAQDFDDAICVEQEGEDLILHIVIADVDFFVPEGSLTDREALRRGTSVYFPDRSVPMLPLRLCHDLCSLRPGVIRLTQGASLRYGPEGRRKGARFHEGYIRSAARLTYAQVAKLLEGGREQAAALEAVAPMVHRAGALARLLERRRGERGAIDFDLPEPEIVLDLTGATVSIEARGRNPAHRLIEEFMIAANEAVAEELLRRKEPTLYRVHEKPPPDRLAKFRDALDGLGYRLPVEAGSQIKPRHFAQLIGLAEGRPEEPLIQRLVLRAMALARYDPACLGHFGLALEHYLHFTSPIRRYPDLIAHRALRRLREKDKESAGEKAERRARLPELARECSRLERDAEAAEREAIAWRKAAYMADRLGEEFAGRIVEVAPHGLMVMLDEPYVEGLIPVARLGAEYFRYDERRRRMIGADSGRVYHIGQEVRVRVDRVDLLRHFIDFALVEAESASATRKTTSARKKVRGGRSRSRGRGGGGRRPGSGRRKR